MDERSLAIHILLFNTNSNFLPLSAFIGRNPKSYSAFHKQIKEVTARVQVFIMTNAMEELQLNLVSKRERAKKLWHEHNNVAQKSQTVAKQIGLQALVATTAQIIKFLIHRLQKTEIEKIQAENQIKEKNEDKIKLIKERKESQAAIHDLKGKLNSANESQKMEIELQIHGKHKEMGLLLFHSKRNNDDNPEAISGAELQNLSIWVSCCQNILGGDVDKALQDMKTDSKLTQEAIEILEEKLKVLADAAKIYPQTLAENKKSYCEIQDLKGNIRVYCRIRPSPSLQLHKESIIEHIGEKGGLKIINPNKRGKEPHRLFRFNKAFGPSASQENVYLDAQPLIRSVLDGYNVCIFAYGQTGSGKTFTMTGPEGSEKDRGVNYRALNDIFQISQERRKSFTYKVGIQMVEIYNEQVRDLFGSQKSLGIRNGGTLSVPDAIMQPVKSAEHVLHLMKTGGQNRTVGANKLNEHSSRSHSVLTVHVEGRDLFSGAILRGRLHLIDLAGSERVDRSNVTGDRLREAQKINKSLSALGDVVSALANKSAHVPYRNSKLTQILQDSLGGQAKTLMFVQVNPDTEFYWDTISTLKFAERVSSVELGAAQSNKESKEGRDLKEELQKVKSLAANKHSEIWRLKKAYPDSKSIEENY